MSNNSIDAKAELAELENLKKIMLRITSTCATPYASGEYLTAAATAGIAYVQALEAQMRLCNYSHPPLPRLSIANAPKEKLG